MKFIVSAGSGTKRTIEGAFAICGSRDDLERLRDELTRGLRYGFSYGWIDICPDRPNTAPNTEPLPWE